MTERGRLEASAAPAPGSLLLRCRGLAQSFAAVRALRGVDFSMSPDKIDKLKAAGASTETLELIKSKAKFVAAAPPPPPKPPKPAAPPAATAITGS